MQSFFRSILALLLIVAAFVGGWYSSLFIQQDPFLANLLPISNDSYHRFLQDISTMVEESLESDQLKLIDMMMKLQEESTAALVQQMSDQERHTENEEQAEETSDINASYRPTLSKVQFTPTDFISTIMQRTSARDKLTFLVWARSRFPTEQLQQMQRMLSQEMTPENMLQLYQLARPHLNGKDLEYLLTFVDLYVESLLPPKPSITPSYQANEGSMIDHYISGN